MQTIPAGKRWEFSEGAEAGSVGRRNGAGIGSTRDKDTDPLDGPDSEPERGLGTDGPSGSDCSRRCRTIPRLRAAFAPY